MLISLSFFMKGEALFLHFIRAASILTSIKTRLAKLIFVIYPPKIIFCKIAVFSHSLIKLRSEMS